MKYWLFPVDLAKLVKKFLGLDGVKQKRIQSSHLKYLIQTLTNSRRFAFLEHPLFSFPQLATTEMKAFLATIGAPLNQVLSFNPTVVEKFISPKNESNTTNWPPIQLLEPSPEEFIIMAAVPGMKKTDLKRRKEDILPNENCVMVRVLGRTWEISGFQHYPVANSVKVKHSTMKAVEGKFHLEGELPFKVRKGTSTIADGLLIVKVEKQSEEELILGEDSE
jgi:HSP20 family molecular chaperone IbpA